MAIYAFRETQHSRTLTEFKSYRALQAENQEHACKLDGVRLYGTTPDYARQWVKNNGHHETALYTNIDGKVRRASDNAY